VSNRSGSKAGISSLLTSIIGLVLLAALIAVPRAAVPSDYQPWVGAIFALGFLALEILAFVLGIAGKKSLPGKVGLALSGTALGILMVISALILLF
jgi:hypothetical protein